MVFNGKEDGQIRVNMGEPIWEPNKIPFTANKFEKNYILRTDVQTVLCGAVSWAIHIALFKWIILKRPM